MSDSERILVVNAYGDVVPGAEARPRMHGMDVTTATITAPGYLTRSVFLDFNRKTADLVLLLIDPETAEGPALEDACQMNLACAAKWAALGGGNLRERFLGDVVKTAQDRVYVTVQHGEELATVLDRTGAWQRVSGRMHKKHEEGFEPYPSKSHCSWKTTRGAPDLQLTLWRQRIGKLDGNIVGYEDNFVAELDIDLRTGKGHAIEVARNRLTHRKTNPLLVVQVLSYFWGVIPFRLEPRE